MIRLEQMSIQDLAKVFIRKSELVAIIREMLNDPSYGILSMDMILNVLRSMDKNELLDLTCMLNPYLLNAMLSNKQMRLQKLISECLKLVKSVEVGLDIGEVFQKDRDDFIEVIMNSRRGLEENAVDSEVESIITSLDTARQSFLDSIIPEFNTVEMNNLQNQLLDLINECQGYCNNLVIGVTPGKIFEEDKTFFQDVINNSYRGLTKKYLYENQLVQDYIDNLQEVYDKIKSLIITDKGFLYRGKYYGESNAYNPDSTKYEWVPLKILADKYWISFTDIPKGIKDFNDNLEFVYGYYDPNGIPNPIIYTYYDLPSNVLVNITVKKATAWDGNCYGTENYANDIINLGTEPYIYVNCSSEYHDIDYSKDIRIAGNYIKAPVERIDEFPTKKSILKKVFNAEGIITYN